MLRKIELFNMKWAPYKETFKVEKGMEDGYIALAYPGKFGGFGDTPEEAMTMARMRLKADCKRFLEAKKDSTESDWEKKAEEREIRISKAYGKWGIRLDSTWNEDNIEKK